MPISILPAASTFPFKFSHVPPIILNPLVMTFSMYKSVFYMNTTHKKLRPFPRHTQLQLDARHIGYVLIYRGSLLPFPSLPKSCPLPCLCCLLVCLNICRWLKIKKNDLFQTQAAQLFTLTSVWFLSMHLATHAHWRLSCYSFTAHTYNATNRTTNHVGLALHYMIKW